jgi:hypothetical protein
MSGFILLVGILVTAAVAHAVTYEWTDSNGGLHFTDSLDKVPATYLDKVRKVDVEPLNQEKVQPSQSEQNSVAPPPQNLFGEHDETWWRSSFRALRDEMKNIQDGLPGKKEILSEQRRKYFIFSKPSDRIALNELNADIQKDEARIAELQEQLATLDDTAAKAGVPKEWRQ